VEEFAKEGAGNQGNATLADTNSPGVALTRPVREYDYAPACRGNGTNADAGGVADCPAAHTCADAAALRVYVSERVVGAAAFHRQPGSVCLTTAQQLTFNPADAQAFVDAYFQRLPLPLPGLTVQPAGQAVVNFPEVVRADAPPGGVFVVNQAPFPQITITAQVRWVWSFGDGAQTTTSWPGQGYDGVDPRSSPEHYVSHTYVARSAGVAVSVTVTAVWTATYRIAGFPDVRTVNGAVERTSTQTLPVAAYGAHLTDN